MANNMGPKPKNLSLNTSHRRSLYLALPCDNVGTVARKEKEFRWKFTIDSTSGHVVGQDARGPAAQVTSHELLLR